MTRRNVRKQGWVFPVMFPDSDDRFTLNFHRFVILYISCGTQHVGLGQYCLLKVSNGFKSQSRKLGLMGLCQGETLQWQQQTYQNCELTLSPDIFYLVNCTCLSYYQNSQQSSIQYDEYVQCITMELQLGVFLQTCMSNAISSFEDQ